MSLIKPPARAIRTNRNARWETGCEDAVFIENGEIRSSEDVLERGLTRVEMSGRKTLSIKKSHKTLIDITARRE